MGKEIKFFHQRFTKVPRQLREKLLCAMIRINYGTPWAGDLEGLKVFFPKEHHRKLVLGGLTELIEALNPFADEPTDYGIEPKTKPESDLDITITEAVEITKTLGEETVNLPIKEITTNLPHEKTITEIK